jgi:prepilin-type N-terminal cleavage/methylation domain-containing protein
MKGCVHPRGSSTGFSLIEFLMVAVILGIGLLGLAALTTTAMRSYGGSRSRDAAIALSSSVLDRLSLDGRITAQLRGIGSAIPGSALVANAVDGAVNPYADPATALGTFDLQGQPSAAAPVFQVSWVRRATKSIEPVASSQSAVSEVVVNVQWSESVRNPDGTSSTQPRYISVSRFIRY